MTLHNIYIRNQSRGFTLIETLVSLAIIVGSVAILMFVDLSSYSASQFNAATNNLVSVMQSARALSLNNVNQSAHGVSIYPVEHPTAYVIFEGSSYANRVVGQDQVIDSGYTVDIDPSSQKEIIFSQLSGDVENGGGNIVLVDKVRKLNFTISTNYEGRISW